MSLFSYTNVGITLFFILLLVYSVIIILEAIKAQRVITKIMEIVPDGRPWVSKFRDFGNQ